MKSSFDFRTSTCTSAIYFIAGPLAGHAGPSIFAFSFKPDSETAFVRLLSTSLSQSSQSLSRIAARMVLLLIGCMIPRLVYPITLHLQLRLRLLNLTFFSSLSTLLGIGVDHFLCPQILHEQCPAALAILPAYHRVGPSNRNISSSHSSRYEDSPDSLLSNDIELQLRPKQNPVLPRHLQAETDFLYGLCPFQ